MLLWLKKHDFLATYKAMKEETRMPSLEEVANKLCPQFNFPRIATFWLIRKGYREKELISKTYYAMFETTNAGYHASRAMRLQFYADNVGLFFGVNPAAGEYITTYQRLRTFVHRCHSAYRQELEPLLYPVLVQLALELIQCDKGDNVRLRAAHELLDLAAADHSVEHREHYLILRGLFRWEHVLQSSLYKEFAVAQRESESNTVVLSPNAFQLICSHTRNESVTQQVNILMRILYLKVNVVVHGLTGPTTPELGLIPDAWSIDADLNSTYIPAWSLGTEHASAMLCVLAPCVLLVIRCCCHAQALHCHAVPASAAPQASCPWLKRA